MSNTARTIRVVIDASAARTGAQQANQALASIGNAGARTGTQLGNTTRGLNQSGSAAQRMASSLNAANDNTRNLNGGLLRMIGSLGRASIAIIGLTALTGGVAALGMAFTGAADGASQMAARLGVAYTAANQLAAANEAVHQIANATRSDLVGVATLYSNLATQSDKLGLSQAQVGTATRIFSETLKISGADANAAAGAIRQLGQAIGSGKLGGDEFASIAEAAPVFMNLLAESMKVPRGALKDLAAQGKITADEIGKALTDPALIAGIEAQFGRIPVTFGDIRTGIGNAMIDIAGAIKKGLGLDQSLAVMLAQIQTFARNSQPFFEKLGTAIRTVFAGLAPIARAAFGVIGPIVMAVVNNMDALVRVAKVAAIAFVTLRAAMAVSTFTSLLAPIIALEKAMGATGTVSALFSAGMKAAQGAVNGFTAALLANPFTAIAVALVAVVGLLYQFSDQIGIGQGHVATLADVANEVLSRIGPMFTAIGETVSSVLGSIGGWFSETFSGISAFLAPFFSGLDFSFLGFARFAARSIDFVITGFVGGFNAIKAVWGALPAVLGAVVTSAANIVVSGIESMINTAISGINGLISMANNIPLVNIGLIGTVSIKRVDGPAMPDIPGLVAGSFQNQHYAENGLNSVVAGADARHQNGGGNSRQTGGALAPTRPASSLAPGGSGSGAADKAKKDLEDIQAKTKEFWTELEEAVKVAGMLPLDAARYNQELELRKILGGGVLKDEIQLNDQQRERIANLMRERVVAAAITDIREETRKAENIGLVNGLRRNGLSERELAIEDALTQRRQKALDDGATLTDITSDTWRVEEARLATVLRQNQAYDDQRAKLEAIRKTGLDLVERYRREADPFGAVQRDRGDRDEAIRSAVKPEDVSDEEWARRIDVALKGSASEFERDMRDANQQFFSAFSDSIGNLAQIFGGKFGTVIGGLVGIFQNLAASLGQDSGLGKSLGKIFGPGSKLVKGLELFGQGAETGAAIADLAKAVGIKGFSSTGSQIGGGIGSIASKVTGIPGLEIVGSVLGGLIGGLFSKPKFGNAVLTGQGAATITGRGKENMAAAGTLAGAVQSGLADIATKLGGQVGSYLVSIGEYKGTFRVNPNGGATNGKNKGFTSYGEDSAAAVAAAIADAISDGAITGLSDLAQKALRAMKPDAAINFVSQWTAAMADFEAMTDPVTAAIKGINTPLDTMRATMISLGAASEDLAKLEQYRALKLDQSLKDQLSSLTSFQKALSGDGSGVTALARLTKDMADFQSFRTDIAAGKQVDQEAFTSLGQEIFQLAGSVYGSSTTAFQDIRGMLMEATGGAISNVQKAYDDAQVIAIQQQTQAITQNQVIQSDYLRQIAEAVANNAQGATLIGVTMPRAVNGSMDYY